MKYGSHTVNSWEMKLLVGTEKTSARDLSRTPPKFEHRVSSLTVQFFQRELLGFSDETEDHEPGEKVQAGVETDWIEAQRWISRGDL